jgi:hypothetical protein
VAADATDSDLEVKRAELEAALNRLTAEADEAVSRQASSVKSQPQDRR